MLLYQCFRQVLYETKGVQKQSHHHKKTCSDTQPMQVVGHVKNTPVGPYIVGL